MRPPARPRVLAVAAPLALVALTLLASTLPPPATEGLTVAALPMVSRPTLDDDGHQDDRGTWEVVTGVYDDDREPPGGPIHSALLPTGKVLLFTYNDTWLFDPATRVFQGPLESPNVIVCAGMAMLGDGRLFVAGGFAGYDSRGRYKGPPWAQVFDPWTETWAETASMKDNRWYPTAITLPDGKVAVFSGIDGGTLATDVEVWDPATDSWSVQGNHRVALYARAHGLPDGTVLFTSPDERTLRWDPATGAFRDGGARGDYRRGGVSVLLDAARGTILNFGGLGDPDSPATADLAKALATAEVYDAGTNSWTRANPLLHQRYWAPGVLLPNGDVLAVGGEHKDSKWAQPSEWYEADTGTWVEVATPRYKRQYHATALLLPDGSVLATGPTPTMEIYKPWYFGRERPLLEDVPEAVANGQAFTVTSPDAPRIARATMVRLGSDTHNLNTDQRLLELDLAPAFVPGELALRPPASKAVAPPGYYLLFLFDDAGVPSLGATVRLG